MTFKKYMILCQMFPVKKLSYYPRIILKYGICNYNEMATDYKHHVLNRYCREILRYFGGHLYILKRLN